MILFATTGEINQTNLDSMNVGQARVSNRENLEVLGGIIGFPKRLGVNINTGLSQNQVSELRYKFGSNIFPESPMLSFMELFFESFQDLIIIILIVASAVSLVIGIFENPKHGWIEGTTSYSLFYL